MSDQLSLGKLINGAPIMEAIIFITYILVCSALFKSRFSRLKTVLVIAAAGAAIIGVNIGVMLSGPENLELVLTLSPLTAFLPFSVLLYFLSDGGLFETTAVCAVGTLEVLILRSLRKILIRYMTAGHDFRIIMIHAAVLLAAAVLVFVTFRYIVKPFRVCAAENGLSRRSRLLLLVTTALVFLMVFYFLNSVTNVTVLFLTLFIAVSVFLIIARLLGTTAEVIRMKRSEKEMSDHINAQRRSYDKLARKMEAGREYRHDMRHHLRIIEGLARQGECDKIIEYTGKMNGSLGELENIDHCKDPEINAVLSEYISRAENSGCRVTESIVLPEKLPFAEEDVCIVLANAVENAINACDKLLREDRYINISAECVDDRRLFVSVKKSLCRRARVRRKRASDS